MSPHMGFAEEKAQGNHGIPESCERSYILIPGIQKLWAYPSGCDSIAINR